MALTTDPNEMEMPCKCEHCDNWFDLDEGRGSEKWYPDTVICAACFKEEAAEIETDEKAEELAEEIQEQQDTIHSCEIDLHESILALQRLQPNQLGYHFRVFTLPTGQVLYLKQFNSFGGWNSYGIRALAFIDQRPFVSDAHFQTAEECDTVFVYLTASNAQTVLDEFLNHAETKSRHAGEGIPGTEPGGTERLPAANQPQAENHATTGPGQEGQQGPASEEKPASESH